MFARIPGSTVPSARSILRTVLRAEPTLDGRSSAGRRIRDVAHALAADLASVSPLNEAEAILLRQAASNVVAIEKLQAEILGGRSRDHNTLSRLTSANNQILAGLRAKRRQTP